MSAGIGPPERDGRRRTVIRTGIGYDSHRFAPGGRMLLGGVEVATHIHLAGHSDGDAVAHALTDALLGAAAAGDIGSMFPDTDPANLNRDSMEMLLAAVMVLRDAGYSVVNADITVIAESPRIAKDRDTIRASVAKTLGISMEQVSLKGKTNEGMGWIGRGEGLACMAVATITREATTGAD
ncbi:MAG: 2-C-methyl-D-erythritol 2,4-cyclodiphosphate synthase [Gemmatimonadales bacterium]